MSIDNEQLLDLLVQRATEGLTPAQERELQRLLSQAGSAGDELIELAAAAADNAFALDEGRLLQAEAPERLKAQLAQEAEVFFNEQSAGKGTVVTLQRNDSKEPTASRQKAAVANHRAGLLGWAVAAVLLLTLVINILGNGPAQQSPSDFARERDRLLQQSDGTEVYPWAIPSAEGFEGVRGDVVWNDDMQQGFLRLSGLPANDPRVSQYQLWIVDPERDQHPVDGGVFDIPPGQEEILVPIRAKLRVAQPAAFAITREQPGGVVVSAGPLLVVASAG